MLVFYNSALSVFFYVLAFDTIGVGIQVRSSKLEVRGPEVEYRASNLE